MRATVREGHYYWCKDCGLVYPDDAESFMGWYDKDGDYYDDADGEEDLDTIEERIREDGEEDTYLPMKLSRTEYECPNCNYSTTLNNLKDLEDPKYDPRFKEITEVWTCGVCSRTYQTAEEAGDCCNG